MRQAVATFLNDLSIPAVTAGFIAVVVGYTSSVAIIFQAAEVAGASSAQLNSWIGALGIGMGVSSIALSLYFKAPVLTAWSTPGAALLATSTSTASITELTAAFMFSAVLIIASGITGWFEKLIDHIPVSLASAMLAGILFQFGLNVFVSMQTELLLCTAMFVTYLLIKQAVPRYAVIGALVCGFAISWLTGFEFTAVDISVTRPVFVAPEFNWTVLLGIGVPLFVVTMTAQNIPGIATLRAGGYNTPVSPVITTTGVVTLVLAPFGCFAINMAAITAAICMDKNAGDDPKRRYTASVAAGIFYCLLGIFGATVGSLLAAVPKELILAVAGLALFATIAGSLATALNDTHQREPALITFLMTASGISLFGVGAAFWGLVFGGFALIIARVARK